MHGILANHRMAICLSPAVMAGTDELMAIPLTALEISRPSRSRSWVSSIACSSGVRSGADESRQW